MKLLRNVLEIILKPWVLKRIWNNRFDEFKKQNKSIKKGSIVFLGDSITQEFNINEMYSKGLIANRGISGDTTSGVLKRMKESVYDIEPKKIFILIGTNDINRPRYSQENTAGNIKSIIECIKTNCPKTEIYIQLIYPINDSIKGADVGKRTNSIINSLNEEIAAIAKESNVQCLDTRTVLEDSVGALKGEYTEDGLHLNDIGYKEVFDYLSNYF